MRWLPHGLLAWALAILVGHPAMAADPVRLYAAGSLKAALSDAAKAYETAYGMAVETEFAASGLLRERIEGGEQADVFASANLQHPRTLMAAGWGGPVALFARNQLCALTQPEVEVSAATLPEELSVGADYGLIVREGASGEAWRLALFILAPAGQTILADYGFTSGALPQKD